VLAAVPNSAEWITAGFTAVGGLGAAFAAWQSRRAAERSDEAASRSTRALAAAHRPRLEARGGAINSPVNGEPWTLAVIVHNKGSDDVVDVEVEAVFEDGTVGRGSVARVRSMSSAVENYEQVRVQPAPLIPGFTSPSNLDRANQAFTEIKVRYSDPERLGQWESIWRSEVIATEDLGSGPHQIVHSFLDSTRMIDPR
jgi:hypothetical protein